MSERTSQTPEGGSLAEIAKAQLRERDQWWEAARADPQHELRPLDELEQARLIAAVVPAIRPARRWTTWARPVLAAAAAALLAVALWPRGDTLPTYTLEARSGDRALRSEAPESSARYSVGSRIELVLRPDAPVREEFAVTVEARDVTGKVVPLSWPIERGRDGAIRITATLGNELSPGDWVLHVDLDGGAQHLRHPIRVEAQK
ncbi:hypothetical protein L6R52_33605 [Myxococcota bacterium]|nr:hypothetical protein [Myxococcota bacterium]